MNNSRPNINALAHDIGARAKAAFAALSLCSKDQRTNAIFAMAKNIRTDSNAILEANKADIENGLKAGLAPSMIDRLKLDTVRIEAIAKALEDIANQSDKIGEIMETYQRPNGLLIEKTRIPIGVIGIIYESRPNVTADAGALCLRAGNVCVLRGGKEAFETSTLIANSLRDGLKFAGLPEDVIQFVPTIDRDFVGEMLRGLDGAINLIVPRGGKTLVARVLDEAKVPVLAHLEGLCHTYIEKSADFEKALSITLNAKMRRTGVCGATETLLIDEQIAEDFLPKIAPALEDKGCQLRGDEKSRKIYEMMPATEEDWRTEFLDAILSIKIVANIDEAIAHIAHYGSGHTDAIISEDEMAASKFLNQVDSSIVIHNASTQYADGGEFGFGGEIGIGTGRLHARGPVGADGLTTYKYVVHGNGQCRP